MDKSKQAAFVRKMGKKRLSLARGGMVKRKTFDGGGIAGLIGAAGGAGGTGFNVNPGTNAAQLADLYNQNKGALIHQNDIALTLEPQIPAAVAAQNTLANQYAQQALGYGPNVAQNQLNQATAANTANQAALMAGQRGATANPALIARQAAQQGAAAQQQAAGQAATLRAQQQIAAQQAGAQLAGNQIAQGQAGANANIQAIQGEQGILQGANTAANNIQGQLANTTMQGQQGLLGGVMNAVGGALGLSEGGEVHNKKLDFVHKMTKLGLEHHGKPHFAEGGKVSPTPAPHEEKSFLDYFGMGSNPAEAQPKDPYQTFSTTPVNPSDLAAGAKSTGLAEGGRVNYDEGGLTVPGVVYTAPQLNLPNTPQEQGGFTPGTNTGAQAMGNSMKAKPKKEKEDPTTGMTEIAETGYGPDPELAGFANVAYNGGVMRNHVANYLNGGGQVPALVSPGEIRLTPEQVKRVVHEGANPLEIGEKIPGKAKVKGNSKKNDIVPKDLNEGDVIIDREDTMDPKKASKFVHKAIAKKRAKR